MNTATFLSDNLKALSKHQPDVAKWLAGYNIESNAINEQLFKNRFQMLDWKMPSGLGLMETLLPHMLYSDWIPKEKAENSASIIVGLNIGYGLNHVLAGTPNTHKVLAIEPRPEMLLATLSQTDYRPFFEVNKLRFLPPDHLLLERQVQMLDIQFLFGIIHLRSDTPSQQLGPEYAKWLSICRDKLESMAVELTTLRFKQEDMVGNEIHNFMRAMRDGSLLPLKNRANGLSAVILGAGPSLSKFAPLLKANPGYALYTTALQTLPALERVGLKPDFCLAIDFREEMRVSVENLKDRDFAKDIPLIYSTKMAPEVLDLYPGPKLPLWTMGGMATFVMQDKEFVLDAGGNVGVTMARFLTWCGVSKVTLVGQDFAWSGNKSHAEGHHAAKADYVFVPERDVELLNQDGQTIYSNQVYLAAKRDLEKTIEATPEIPFFNLYGGGAPILGSRSVNLEEARLQGLFASVLGSKDAFLQAMAEANAPRTRPVFEARHKKWTVSLRHAEKKLEKLFKKSDKKQNEIGQMFMQILYFFKQDPLYLPYLYNDIMDMARLAQAVKRYTHKEFSEYKQLVKKILAKVKEMDENLGSTERQAA